MKQNILSLFAFFLTISLFANDLTKNKKDLKLNSSFKSVESKVFNGFEDGFSSSKISATGNDYAQNSTAQLQAPIGTVVGLSTYDLQTNRGVCRRVALSGNSTFVYTGWTQSQTYNVGSPERGTGYNFFNRNTDVWQAIPSARIEPTTRVGWPNIGFTSAGRQFSITHTGANGMMFCWKDGNQSEWTETIVGNLVGDIEADWPRSAVDGEKIHVVMSRLGTTFAGVELGVNYIRSLDNGETWESMGSFVPDYSSTYARMDADAYQIDAKDGNVAFIFGCILSETDLYLSNDDGDTWEKTTLVESSNPTVSYINADDGFFVEPYWGTYGGNTVIFDSNNMPHVVYSGAFQFNIAENDFASGGNYIPVFESTALWYWNPTMAEPEIIGKTVMNDADNDGALGSLFLDPNNVKTHSNDMVGQPMLSIDENDNLYVSYAANVDGDFQPADLTIQTSFDGGVTLEDYTFSIPENSITYKDVFLIKKQANSNEWEGPLNLTNSPATDDLYASMQRNVVDSTLYLIYQSDSLTGNVFIGQLDIGVQNEQPVVAINVNDINNAAAPPDSEPYVMAIPWVEPYVIAQGCEFTNDLFYSDYIVGMDYPDGFVPVELFGDVDYSTPGDYTEVLQAVDSQGNVSDPLEIQISIVEDTEAPTMEVAVPCNDFAIIAGSTWENPLVDIIDNSMCDLYPLLQEQGNVDPNTIGDYTVIYNVSDYAGNPADPLTLNVSVIAADTEGPEITFVNAPDTLPIYGTVPEIEVVVLDNVDCENVTFTIEGNDLIETAIPGSYDVTVTAEDSSGNVSTQTITIVVSDNIAPSLELDSNPITTDCGDDGQFDENDLGEDFVIVDDNFTSSDELILTVDFSEVDCSTNGKYEVLYTVEDEAGNIDEVTLTVIVQQDMIMGVEDYLLKLVDIYPNPTQGTVNVDVSDLKVNEINVYNVVGELIYSLPINTFATSNNIDLSEQPEGVYLINVSAEEGSITKKLTISK